MFVLLNRVVFSVITLCMQCVIGLGFFPSALAQVIVANSPADGAILPLNAKQQASLGVQVAPVQAASAGQLLAIATVVTPPGRDFAVSAPYPGQISRLLVGIGDTVKAGAPLAEFTSAQLGEARRQLDQAVLDFNTADAALKRDQAMFEEGIIPAVRLQLTRTRQEAAQAQLSAREAELAAAGIGFETRSGYATGVLKAPLSGTVLEAFTAVGQRVEAGTVLFRLADFSQLQLDLQLSSEKARQLNVGDEILIASHNAKARIIGVGRAVDVTQSARARAVVTTRGSLQPGNIVTVVVQAKAQVGTAKPNTQWLVPARAVTQWRGQSWIFLAHEKGFQFQAVAVLSSTDDLSLIEAALPTQAKVAVAGIASLRALVQKDE